MRVFLSKRSFKSTLVLFLIAALLNLFLFPLLTSKVNAGTFTSAKMTISDSRAGQTSTSHDFVFTPALTTAIKTIDFVYCTAASGTCTTPTGLTTTGGSQGTPTGISGTGYASTFTTNGTITLTVTTPAAQTIQAITVPYSVITNPTTADTTFFVRITTKNASAATIDTATVAAAILTTTSIAVTASVDPTLTFTVAAANTGTVNGATINVTTSTAILIPFGTLSSGSTKIAAHDLSVTTNAINGYTITVKAAANPPLADVDENIDIFTGTNAAPATWSAPAGTAKSVNTGFFGYTTNDVALGTGTVDRFTSAGGNKWAGPTTSALEVAYSAVGVSTEETTRVGWQAAVNGLQPPGSYSGTVVLVATPTY